MYRRYLSRGLFLGFALRDIPKENPNSKMMFINLGDMQHLFVHDLECIKELISLIPQSLERVDADKNLLGRIARSGARDTIPNKPIREAFTRTMEINQCASLFRFS